MDNAHFDAISRSLAIFGNRRGIIRLLGVLPLVGVLTTVVDGERAGATRRRPTQAHRAHPRAKVHEQTKNKKKKKHKPANRQPLPSTQNGPCVPQSDAETCAGRCDTVQNRCGQNVDCGGDACRGTTPFCISTTCTGCSGSHSCPSGCCAGDRSCQPGTGNGACGLDGDMCDVCIDPAVCVNRSCCTPVDSTCGATSCNQTNNCGQRINCCAAAGATNPDCDNGACCERSVGLGSFCSATVPCCQMGQPGSRRCNGGSCCVNSGFPTALPSQCCSGGYRFSTTCD